MSVKRTSHPVQRTAIRYSSLDCRLPFTASGRHFCFHSIGAELREYEIECQLHADEFFFIVGTKVHLIHAERTSSLRCAMRVIATPNGKLSGSIVDAQYLDVLDEVI